MILKELKNKEEYNSYCELLEKSQFSQSWEWGEFQASIGFQIFRFGVYEEKELKFAFTLIRKKIFRNLFYFYCPRFDNKNLDKKEMEFLFKEIAKKAEEEKVIFLRFEPLCEFNIEEPDFLIQKTIDVQPSRSIILDLRKSEDKLLSTMRQKTRYNIRLAERKGVFIREASVAEFDKFWQLLLETGKRDNFRLHDKNYYRKMLKISEGTLNLKLFFALYNDKIVAANIISFFGDIAVYVHGASSAKYRNVMAPYLLQWEVIKKAKNEKYKYYDFHGIGDGSLAGVTKFKKGFAGEEVIYPGVYDVIFNKKLYKLYGFLRKIRRFFKF